MNFSSQLHKHALGCGESSLNSMDNLVHHFTSSWVAKDIYYSYNLARELKPAPSFIRGSTAETLVSMLEKTLTVMANGRQNITFHNSNFLKDFQMYFFLSTLYKKRFSNIQRNRKNCTENIDTPTS